MRHKAWSAQELDEVLGSVAALNGGEGAGEGGAKKLPGSVGDDFRLPESAKEADETPALYRFRYI